MVQSRCISFFSSSIIPSTSRKSWWVSIVMKPQILPKTTSVINDTLTPISYMLVYRRPVGWQTLITPASSCHSRLEQVTSAGAVLAIGAMHAAGSGLWRHQR